MRSVQTTCSRRTAATIVFSVAVLFSSIELAEADYINYVYGWQPINPVLSSLVQYGACGEGAWKAKARPVTVKVGHPYLLYPYTKWEETKWGAEVFWNPVGAAAKRTFVAYDVASLTPEKWNAVTKAFQGKEVMTGLFVGGKEGYYGTPVKWDDMFVAVMGKGFTAAASQKDRKNAIVATMVAEILELGTLKGAPQLKPDGPKIRTLEKLLERRVTRDLLAKYYCGDLASVQRISPKTPVYIGFSKMVKELGPEGDVQLITQRGAFGQPLGVAMPSWPTEEVMKKKIGGMKIHK